MKYENSIRIVKTSNEDHLKQIYEWLKKPFVIFELNLSLCEIFQGKEKVQSIVFIKGDRSVLYLFFREEDQKFLKFSRFIRTQANLKFTQDSVQEFFDNLAKILAGKDLSTVLGYS